MTINLSIVTIEIKQTPRLFCIFLTSYLVHKMHVKDSFHESLLNEWDANLVVLYTCAIKRRGRRKEQLQITLSHSSGAAREMTGDECDVGASCNYFTRIGAPFYSLSPAFTDSNSKGNKFDSAVNPRQLEPQSYNNVPVDGSVTG